MISLIKAIEKISQIMYSLGGIFLISMLLITVLDILTRGIFTITDGNLDFTFIGGIEIVQYSLLLTVLLILPYSVKRSQVIVDLFTDRLKQQTKQVLEGIYLLSFGLMGVGMSYSYYHLCLEASETYETSLDLLIPLTYFYAIACFATAMLAISAATHSFQILFLEKAKL